MPKWSPTRYQVSSWLAFTHKCSPTRYQVSNWTTLCVISILGIEIGSVEASIRYQESSWCLYGPHLDTWYRVYSPYGPQLDTKYGVGILMGINSILGIDLNPLEPQLDTKYQVAPQFGSNSILGIELGVVCRIKLETIRTIRVRVTCTPISRASLKPSLRCCCCCALLLCALFLLCSTLRVLSRFSHDSVTLLLPSRFKHTLSLPLTLSPSLTHWH